MIKRTSLYRTNNSVDQQQPLSKICTLQLSVGPPLTCPTHDATCSIYLLRTDEPDDASDERVNVADAAQGDDVKHFVRS